MADEKLTPEKTHQIADGQELEVNIWWTQPICHQRRRVTSFGAMATIGRNSEKRPRTSRRRDRRRNLHRSSRHPGTAA
jgi:hypothetical protein